MVSALITLNGFSCFIIVIIVIVFALHLVCLPKNCFVEFFRKCAQYLLTQIVLGQYIDITIIVMLDRYRFIIQVEN